MRFSDQESLQKALAELLERIEKLEYLLEQVQDSVREMERAFE